MSFLNNATRRNQALFAATGVTSFVTSGMLFRDLADLSQWVLHADRQEIFETFANRHKLAALSVGSMMGNTFVKFKLPPTTSVSVPIWAAVNGASLAMLYSGYINPELMMRPRNRNAMFVKAQDVGKLFWRCESWTSGYKKDGGFLQFSFFFIQHPSLSLSSDLSLPHPKPSFTTSTITTTTSSSLGKYLQEDEPVIVTHAHDGQPRAFPDTQVLRPHVVRIGYTATGNQVTMTYCGLTNLGVVYEIPKNPKTGQDVELIPMTQLENNLILLDKKTGHVGQQINGIDETELM